MKFSGKIGFVNGSIEIEPDVWVPNIIERHYTGDMKRSYRKYQSGEYLNDNMRLNNQIEIISDLYLRQNWPSILYVLWDGVRWKVNTTEVGYPKLVLEIGGVYNGEVPSKSGEDISSDSEG